MLNKVNISKKVLPTALIFGIPVFSASREVLLEILTSQIENTQTKRCFLVFTPNPEQITLALHSREFKAKLIQADINLPDGAGLVWAINQVPGSSGKSNTVKRIAGREVFHDLLGLAKAKQWRVFLLGGKPGSASIIMRNFHFSISNFQYDAGDKNDTSKALNQIKTLRPQVLFVAYGAPWQENWLVAHREALESIGVKMAMVVGGAFEYEAGLVPRVPTLVIRLHLEWLWRLVHDPRRAGRQLRGLEFFGRVLLGRK